MPTNAQVSVDAGVTSSSCKIFVFSIWYVLMCTCISVFFGKTKVYEIHQISFLSQTHQEVVWFYIPMNKILWVNVFDSAYLQNTKIAFHEM